MKTRHALLIILLAVFKISFPQSAYYNHITTNEGLPSSIVHDVIQDSKGFMWFGTESGLYKYDGYVFKKYNVPNTISTSYSAFKKDAKGTLFFKNFSNQLFYLAEEKIVQITIPKPVSNTGFFDYDIDTNDNLYIISDKIYVYSLTTKTWKIDRPIENKNVKRARILCRDNGEVWAIADTLILQKKNKEYRIKGTTSRSLNSIYKLNNSIFKLDNLTNEIKVYNDSSHTWSEPLGIFPKAFPNKINFLISDDDLNIWALNKKGVTCFNKDYKPLEDGLNFLNDQFVSSMYKDREDNYWFSTIGNGIYVLYDKNILTFNEQNSFLSTNQINQIQKIDVEQLIIAGNSKKVIKYDYHSKDTLVYKLPEVDVECFFVDADNNELFIENGNLEVFNIMSGKKDRRVIAGYTPKDIAELNTDLLLVASGTGGYIVDKRSNLNHVKDFIENFNINGVSMENNGILLRSKRSRCVWKEKNNNRFWVGYADGLRYYENGFEEELLHNNNKIIALDIVESRDVVWVATLKQGVLAIKDKKIIEHLSADNLLASNFCKIIRTNKDELWIATDKGLQSINLENKKTGYYTKTDGLASNEITDLEFTEDKLWIATTDGLTVLSQNKTPNLSIKPLAYINTLKVNNNHFSGSLKELEYHQNDIAINYCGLAFNSNKDFKYKYRLAGLDTDWITVSSAINVVRYQSLSPGNYTFEVKTINRFGAESELPAKVSFSISKPYWTTWWFILLVILCAMALTAVFFMYRIKTIHTRNKLENETLKANLIALKAQMNPHFLFNSLSTIQSFILKGDPIKANNYLAKFAKLTRQVLENSREDFITLDEELSILKNYLYLEMLQSEKAFTYELQIKDDVNPKEIRIPPLLIQPFLENAIKHGIKHSIGKGFITIKLSKYDDYVLVEITDNGLGIQRTLELNPKDTHKSLSTSITKKRLQGLRKSGFKTATFKIEDITDKNAKVIGTKVKLYLPFIEEHTT